MIRDAAAVQQMGNLLALTPILPLDLCIAYLLNVAPVPVDSGLLLCREKTGALHDRRKQKPTMTARNKHQLTNENQHIGMNAP